LEILIAEIWKIRNRCSFLIAEISAFRKLTSLLSASRAPSHPDGQPVPHHVKLLEIFVTRIKSVFSRFLVANFRALFRTPTQCSLPPLTAGHCPLGPEHSVFPARSSLACPEPARRGGRSRRVTGHSSLVLSRSSPVPPIPLPNSYPICAQQHAVRNLRRFLASIVAFLKRSVYVLRRSKFAKREQILSPQRIASTRTYFKQMENA
jgi:hypothetical protein